MLVALAPSPEVTSRASVRSTPILVNSGGTLASVSSARTNRCEHYWGVLAMERVLENPPYNLWDGWSEEEWGVCSLVHSSNQNMRRAICLDERCSAFCIATSAIVCHAHGKCSRSTFSCLAALDVRASRHPADAAKWRVA